MSYFFLDSSALIKRYVVEAGTDWIRSIMARSAGHTHIIAHITMAEVVSGVMRRKREGAISARTARATRLLIDRHASREYIVVGLTGQIIQDAEDLLERYPLRAYDSIQLASALETSARLVAAGLPRVTFISSDIRLLTAASAEGLLTDDANNHS
jgi:hypothetical protein